MGTIFKYRFSKFALIYAILVSFMVVANLLAICRIIPKAWEPINTIYVFLIIILTFPAGIEWYLFLQKHGGFEFMLALSLLQAVMLFYCPRLIIVLQIVLIFFRRLYY